MPDFKKFSEELKLCKPFLSYSFSHNKQLKLSSSQIDIIGIKKLFEFLKNVKAMDPIRDNTRHYRINLFISPMIMNKIIHSAEKKVLVEKLEQCKFKSTNEDLLKEINDDKQNYSFCRK